MNPRSLLARAVQFLPPERREWGLAMLAELEHIPPGLARWRFSLGCAAVALFPPNQPLLANPLAAALLGLLLALPIPLFLTIVALQIEPLHTALRTWFTGPGEVRQTTSSFLALFAAFLLLPIASRITLTPNLRARRAGLSLTAAPVNLTLGVAILALFLTLAGIVALDQLPCFFGRPNCD